MEYDILGNISDSLGHHTNCIPTSSWGCWQRPRLSSLLAAFPVPIQPSSWQSWAETIEIFIKLEHGSWAALSWGAYWYFWGHRRSGTISRDYQVLHLKDPILELVCRSHVLLMQPQAPSSRHCTFQNIHFFLTQHRFLCFVLFISCKWRKSSYSHTKIF